MKGESRLRLIPRREDGGGFSDSAVLVRARTQLKQSLTELGPVQQPIPGVGPLTMVATYHRGQFRSADSFIAFLGMDVRVRDSGKFRGQRKLTVWSTTGTTSNGLQGICM